jgi:hypothetical protein
VLSAGEGQDALEDREPGPGDEDAERGEEGPEVPFLAVAERVVAARRPVRLAQRHQEEELIERIGGGASGLGEHRAGSAHDPGR